MKKTTLNIPEPLFRKLKHRAIERGETMSNLVAEFIRRGLEGEAKPEALPPLPAFDMGEFKVDIADRNALDRVLNAERDARLYGTTEEE